MNNPTTSPQDIIIGQIIFKVSVTQQGVSSTLVFTPIKMLDGAVKKGITKLVQDWIDSKFPTLKGKWTSEHDPKVGLKFTAQTK